MSYILDALKRADADRERGVVPGLHSQPSTPAPAATPTHAPSLWPRWAVLGLCALLLLAAVLWWFTRTAPPAPAQVQVAAPQAAPPPPQRPAPTASPMDTPPPATAVPVPAPPLLRPDPPVATIATAPAVTAPARATDSATVGRAQPKPAQPQDAEASDAGVRRFADLSPEQRAQLPQLNVNGASYSANPAHRMLIVNGAVLHEGQDVAPGLTLERIGLHQAVIRQGGLRFSIAY